MSLVRAFYRSADVERPCFLVLDGHRPNIPVDPTRPWTGLQVIGFFVCDAETGELLVVDTFRLDVRAACGAHELVLLDEIARLKRERDEALAKHEIPA